MHGKKSWRDVIKVHPAADLFPLMSPDEKAFGENVKKNGVLFPVVLWATHPGAEVQLLDGRNRLDKAEWAGIKVFEVRRDKGNRIDLCVPHRQLYGSGGGISMIDGSSLNVDPYEFVLSANIHRRHLKPEDIDGLIAKILKARPEMSNRQVAKAIGKSHPYVAKTRKQLEQAGDVETVTTSIDTKGRQQPAKKKRRTADDFIAEKKAREKAQAQAVADRAEERSRRTQHVAEQTQQKAAEAVMPKQAGSEPVRPLEPPSKVISTARRIYLACLLIESALHESDIRARYEEIAGQLEELRKRVDNLPCVQASVAISETVGPLDLRETVRPGLPNFSVRS